MRLLLLLCLAACGPRGARDAAPAKIDVSCQLVPDGATCEFANVGGRASRCVRALAAVRSSGTVVTSDELCSGRLEKGAKITVVTRFPRRPVELCGERPSESCAVKVVEAANADAAAEKWQKDLFVEIDGGLSSRKGPLSASECKKLAEHIYQLRYTEELSYATSPQEKDEMRRYMMEERQYIIEDWTYSCTNEMTRPVASCMKHAGKFEDLDACWEKTDE